MRHHRLTGPTSEAVDLVARDYIEGWYTGDVGRMERSLHDDLLKRTPAPGATTGSDLRSVSKSRMVQLTTSGGGRGVVDPAIEVFVDDVSENIASARTFCVDFVDYLHLARTPDGWKIANILFRALR